LKAIVIGAGLGGLLSASKLARNGFDVEVFEQLPMIGGRFTNIEYKGYKLSTGALHMVPHGPSGPLAQLLDDVGAEVEIIRSNPMSSIRIPINNDLTDYSQGYRDIPFNHFTKPFSLINRFKIAFYTSYTKLFPPNNGSFKDWYTKHLDEDWTHRIAESFCGWSLSLRSEELPVQEAFDIFSKLYRYSGSGIPLGGCEGITRSLEKVIIENGGKIHTNSEVTEILTKDGKACGIVCEGKKYSADIIISNLGHKETLPLCNSMENDPEYIERVNQLKPSAGIKICLGSSEPLIGHSGVVLTPYCQRINGMNEVTNTDPTLAPGENHLIMTHQCIPKDKLDSLEKEIEIGLRDIKTMFQGKDYEILLIQSYHNGWPVNRAGSGQDIGNSTPVQNLFIVGDGAKGHGGIEIEGIALGVKNTMKMILT